MVTSASTTTMWVGIPTGSPSTINSDHNFYIFRDGASNNNGGVSQYGSYGRSSPGTLLMNIDGPTAHAIQRSGEDTGYAYTDVWVYTHSYGHRFSLRIVILLVMVCTV